jgi:hypothetical protein
MILSIPRPARPRVFQHSWVRPSSGRYPAFILAVRRSRGFASTAPDRTPVRTRFPSGSAAVPLNPPGTVSRRIIMQKARGQACRLPGVALPPLVGVWFQGQCPPLVGVLPTVRSRYSPLSVAREYLALGDGPPGFGPTSTWWAVLRVPARPSPPSPTGLSPAPARLPRRFGWRLRSYRGPTTPGAQAPPVWAGPRSLAATDGVEVSFSSSGY